LYNVGLSWISDQLSVIQAVTKSPVNEPEAAVSLIQARLQAGNNSVSGFKNANH
jgi:hypothetical protein